MRRRECFGCLSYDKTWRVELLQYVPRPGRYSWSAHWLCRTCVRMMREDPDRYTDTVLPYVLRSS